MAIAGGKSFAKASGEVLDAKQETANQLTNQTMKEENEPWYYNLMGKILWALEPPDDASKPVRALLRVMQLIVMITFALLAILGATILFGFGS